MDSVDDLDPAQKADIISESFYLPQEQPGENLGREYAEHQLDIRHFLQRVEFVLGSESVRVGITLEYTVAVIFDLPDGEGMKSSEVREIGLDPACDEIIEKPNG